MRKPGAGLGCKLANFNIAFNRRGIINHSRRCIFTRVAKGTSTVSSSTHRETMATRYTCRPKRPGASRCVVQGLSRSRYWTAADFLATLRRFHKRRCGEISADRSPTAALSFTRRRISCCTFRYESQHCNFPIPAARGARGLVDCAG